MITVEFSESQGDVGIIFDEVGAKLLVEFLEGFLLAGKQDHIHMHVPMVTGQEPVNGRHQLSKHFALSLDKINPRPDLKVSDLVTLVFRPQDVG